MGVEDDKKAKETVLKVLQEPSIKKLKFTINTTVSTKPVSINTRTIAPSMYEKVAEAITKGQITVTVAPEALRAGVAAKYFPVMTIDKDNEFYDVIVLRASGLGTTANETFHAAAAIVHECTHAGFDALKITKMTHLEHEAASYVAGAVFTAERMLAAKGNPQKVTGMHGIEQAAWDIALLEVASKPVPKTLYDALDAAIRADPEYKDVADTVANNDGVGRQWKIKQARQ